MTNNTNSESQAGQGVRQIPLGKGLFALVDEADFERLAAVKWHPIPTNNRYYAARTALVAGRETTVLMHRVIVDAPKASVVDHRDGDSLNNTRQNLRFATLSQNQQNIRSSHNQKRGLFKGVSPDRGRWRAAIGITEGGKSRNIYLGSFKDPADAARAYDAAALKYFGEFAAQNFRGGDQ